METIKIYGVKTALYFSIIFLLSSCSQDKEPIGGETVGNISNILSKVCTQWNTNRASVAEYMNDYTEVSSSYPNIAIFRNPQNGQTVTYKFEKDRLCASVVVLDNSSKIATDEMTTLLKSFSYIGDVDDCSNYENLSSNTFVSVYSFNRDNADKLAIGFTPIESEAYGTLASIGVTTGDVIELYPVIATVEGTLRGVDKAVKVYCYYGTDPDVNPDKCRISDAVTASEGKFTMMLNGVISESTIYYRAYTQIDGIDYWGDVMSFESLPVPYSQNGQTYEMIKVEGGPYGDFCMMQTELDPNSPLTIGEITIPALNRNGDYETTKGEIREFLSEISNTLLLMRYPTSEEWKLAARGGLKSMGLKYSGSNFLDEVAWYKENSNGMLHAVAQKQPNELGFYDMCGNRSEIINDAQISVLKEGKLTQRTRRATDAPAVIVNSGGQAYGGNWSSFESDCTIDSYFTTLQDYTFDASKVTIRLVFSNSY